MGAISSQFCVTAITDGVTIHGSLSSSKSLTQVLYGNSVIDSWDARDPKNVSPVLTLTVLKGSEFVSPRTYTWYYNGTEIEAGDERFVMGTTTKNGVTVPTLKIVRDLASEDNADLDTITIAGQIETNGVMIDFNAGLEVRISRMTSSGYYAGFLTPDGNEITESGQTIRIGVKLFMNLTEITKNNFTVDWYINYDTKITNNSAANGTYYGSSNITEDNGNTTSRHCLFLNEADVTDFTVVRCDFKVDGKVVYSALMTVNDAQDPDMLYVMFGTGSIYDGKPASLHSGQSVQFKFWVATSTNHKDTHKNSQYSTYQLMLLKNDGTVITNWITLTATERTVDGMTMKSGSIPVDNVTLQGGICTIPYDSVLRNGGMITGIIKAQ